MNEEAQNTGIASGTLIELSQTVPPSPFADDKAALTPGNAHPLQGFSALSGSSAVPLRFNRRLANEF